MADDPEGLKAKILAGIDEETVAGVRRQLETMVTEIRSRPDPTRETFRSGVRSRLAARAAAIEDIEAIFKD